MKRCPAYRQVIPWEKRCTKKEEETGVKPSYCLFDGDIERCRIYEYLVGETKKSKESVDMIMDEKEMDEQIEKYMRQGVKPCKKCGELPDLVQVAAGLCEVKCKCGRTTPVCGSVKTAFEEWNNNVADLGGKKLEPLKPCKCGVMPHLEAIKYRGSTHYRYECPNCGTTTLDFETEAEAEAEWNVLCGIKRAVTSIDVKEVSLVAEPANPNCAIKDSGERRQFETGAVRDMAEGKGLMVVMPAAALLRLSRHYEHGAKKYGKFNWQKGIPTSSFMDSALRHIMKYLDGWDDEDHLAAAAFNILGAMEMEAHKPAMQDIPAREGCVSFNYVEYPSN